MDTKLHQSTIKIYYSPKQYFYPQNHLEHDLVANSWGAEVGERKATRSKMKLIIKKKRGRIDRRE